MKLHFELQGSGPKLLYCNGSGATLQSVRPLLRMLASRFELLAFDYRGMGAGGPVAEQDTMAPYTMADIAADVAELLDDVGWQRSAVLGMSFGGMVAQEFAVTFPERVERLALLATSPGGAFASYPLDRLVELPDEERAARSLQLVDRRWTPEWFGDHPEQLGLTAGFKPERDDLAHRLQLQARKGHDVLNRLHRIDCPTFIGSGRYDDITPVVNGQALADRIPGATLHIYNGGHPFLIQDPAAWPDLAAFLSAGTE